jgi:acyl-CoA dehydrogenase
MSVDVDTSLGWVFQESVEALAVKYSTPEVDDRGAWEEISGLGWPGLLVPEQQGGFGFLVRDLAFVIETLGARGLETPLLCSSGEAVVVLRRAGQERWLSDIAAGEATVVAALHEDGPELVPDAVRTTATRVADGGLVLSGRKTLVGHADAFIVTARVDAGLCLAIVPRDAPGARLTPLATNVGPPLHGLTLESVSVGAEQVLATDDAWSTIEGVVNLGATLRCYELLGLARRALELTLAYVDQRVQFGRTLSRLSPVQRHCVEMYVELEKVRSLNDQALRALEDGRESAWEISLAKAKASEAVPWILRMAHQLHGGVGYYTDYPLERLYRRSMAAQTASGSAAWHRRRLGRLLRENPARFRHTPC